MPWISMELSLRIIDIIIIIRVLWVRRAFVLD